MTDILPIHSVLPELRHALLESRRAVLCAPPGSGKTTVTPPALRNESWLERRSILIVEPRRLAARLAAVYMSGQLGEKVGGTVGYQVRFDHMISSLTRIEVITEGILIRRLQHDPELTGVGLIIFDEFHERSLESDFALALCLDAINALREDLRLLVMSATIDPGPISLLLGGAPVITCHGNMYPVEIVLIPPPPRTNSSRSDHLAINIAHGVRRALAEQQQGDILAFLPGAGEIRQSMTRLADATASHDAEILPLYGNLSLADQSRAIRPAPQGKRRVILATTIAETSITIEGISTVIDCGWKRTPRFDPNCGLTRLETVRISKASANQRKGRAGRLGPGVCYRLWGTAVEHSLPDFDRPEILEADLAGLVLQSADWGTVPDQLKWLDPPPKGALAQAVTLLSELGALDQNVHITSTGREMAGLPLHPRLAHMIIKAKRIGCLPLAFDLAALLSERDIMKGRDRSVDISDRLHLLNVFRKKGAGAARALGADSHGCHRVDKISRQLGKLIPNHAAKITHECPPGTLSALAFPDRIAQQRSGSDMRYKLTSGRGVSLIHHDRISYSPYLTVAALDAGKIEGRIFLAAPLDKQDVLDLFAERLIQEDEIVWDEKTTSISAQALTRLGALIVDEYPLSHPDPGAMQEALLEGIRQTWPTMLPWNKESRALQERVNSLRLWQPDQQWPDLKDEHLVNSMDEWLAPFLTGIRSPQQLNSLDMMKILYSRLDWNQQKRLDLDAPTHIQVPSGSRIKLRYTAGEPPILAVRLQEMFGLAETPAICRGRVSVLLHLLSPAQRIIQITSDLKGFWDGSYYEVKREMKGRYPKHYWPDNPLQATPTNRVKPKSQQ